MDYSGPKIEWQAAAKNDSIVYVCDLYICLCECVCGAAYIACCADNNLIRFRNMTTTSRIHTQTHIYTYHGHCRLLSMKEYYWGQQPHIAQRTSHTYKGIYTWYTFDWRRIRRYGIYTYFGILCVIDLSTTGKIVTEMDFLWSPNHVIVRKLCVCVWEWFVFKAGDTAAAAVAASISDMTVFAHWLCMFEHVSGRRQIDIFNSNIDSIVFEVLNTT